jgi:anti-sigma-K factor RskA
MSETTHERWSEELSAYLLGALEPPEAEALEHHIAGCERCRTELRWLVPALDALPETIERIEPPPQLRARLMAEVHEELGTEPEPAPGHPVLERLRAAFTGPHWRPLVAGVAVVLIAAAVVGYEVGSNGGSEGGGVATTTFEHREPSGVLASVVMEGEHGRLRLSNVAELPPDRVLEAWVRRNGEIEPVPTLFVPNSRGEAATTLGNMDGVDTVMVTTEPPGGSRAPTSNPITTVPIPQA